MIGAGGSARALAFYMAEIMGRGKLLICNRTARTALSLTEHVTRAFGDAQAIGEEEIAEWAPRVSLIVNCSTKGQGGVRKNTDGTITILEAYSALAPANPVTFSVAESDHPGFYHKWLSASRSDIDANNRASLRLALKIPPDVGFCDLIYFPFETVFLRHGQLSGHRTLNGRGMNVAQAADAFFDKVCRRYLQDRNIHNAETYKRIAKIMSEAW
jgi:shikimate 5-dehydrogenase